MKKIMQISLLLPLLIGSCMPSSSEIAEAISLGLTQTEAAQPTITLTATLTFTPTSTSTLTPTLTLTPTSTLTPTITPSLTFTPTPPSNVHIEPNTPIRSGPGKVFLVISRPAAKVELSLVGKSSDGNWIIVELANGNTGWIQIDYVEIQGSIEGLANMTPPPTPSKITITLVNNTNTTYRVEGPFGHAYMGGGRNWDESATVLPGAYSFQVCNEHVNHNKKCGSLVTLTFNKDTRLNITQLDLP